MADWERVPEGESGWEVVPTTGKRILDTLRSMTRLAPATQPTPVDPYLPSTMKEATLAAQGAREGALKGVGLPVDIIGGAMGIKDPIGGGQSLNNAVDWAAQKLGGNAPVTADTTGEKLVHGAFEGAGEVLAPYGVARKVAQGAGAVPTLTQRVAEMMASQPGSQAAMSALGGATSEATGNPIAGLAASLAVPGTLWAARGAISPVKSYVGPNEANVLSNMKTEGIKPLPGQATNNPNLQSLESFFTSAPGAAGPMKTRINQQRGEINQAIMAKTGQTATEAGPDTMTKTFASLGQTADDLISRTTLRPDNQFINDVINTAQQYSRRLPTDIKPVFQSYIEDLMPFMNAGRAGQQIPGDVYKNIRSDMARRARSTNDPYLKEALQGLESTLDDLVERSTSGALNQEWKDWRKQYTAAKTVETSMEGGTQADRAAGNIPLGRFSSEARDARNRGQYGDLAKVADYIAAKTPDSGTPTRYTWAHMLSGGALGGGAGLVTGDPTMAALAATLPVAAPYVASKLYNNPTVQRYLSNQVAGNTNVAGMLSGEAVRQAANAKNDDSLTRKLAQELQAMNERMRRH